MSKVLIDIEASVQRGDDRLHLFAKTAGMTAEEFAAKWRSAPGEALAAFVQGLANAESQGSSTLEVLSALGITEVRMRDALLGSAAAADTFTGAMNLGNQAFEENSALTDEAAKRYETTQAKLQIMGNKVVDAAISLGEHLLPAVEMITEGVGGFADMLSGLDGPMGAVVAWTGVIAAGILLTGGAALVAVPQIAAYRVAAEQLGLTTKGLGGKLQGIGSFLAGPWGVALAAGALATHVFNESLRNSTSTAQELESAIRQGGAALDQMLDKSNQNEAGAMSLLVDVSQHFENLPALADKAANAGRGFWSSMTFNENAALDSIKEFGTTLATLSSSDLPRAQAAFKQFVTDSGLNDTQALTLMNEEMGDFKLRLIEIAESSGLATDDATLLKIALGEIGPAALQSAPGMDQQIESLEELQGVASDTSDEVSKLADEIRDFGNAQFDMERASLTFHESLRGLQEQAASGAASLDRTTEAGYETHNAMLDVASSTNDYAAAVAAAGGSTEEISGILASGRDQIIAFRMSMGESRAEAERYANQLIATPDVVKTRAELNTQPARRSLAALIGEYHNKQITIRAVVQQVGSVLGGAVASNAAGGLYAYANGGIESYADGGVSPGIYRGGSPIHKFAEPEVGWEAYISGKHDARNRNRQIWVEAGRRLGMDTVQGKTEVHVTVNAAPGMSEADLADRVIDRVKRML